MSRRSSTRASTPPRTSPIEPSARSAPLLPGWAGCFDPRQPFLVPLALLLVARIAYAMRIPFSSEDAYITFRYARNFASGNGLVFNPGEHVFGFSSPLWTVWVGLGYALTHQPVLWTRITTFATDAMALVLMASLLQRHVSRAAAWCFAIFFAGWPYFTAVAVSGMENSTLFAMIVLAAVLVERRSWFGGPALAGVVLLRPEGTVAALLLALIAGMRERVI